MGEEEKLDEIKKILQDACDRDWEDESLFATASIAANGLYWRGKEIVRLRGALKELLAQVESFEGVEFSRDFPVHEAESCYDAAISEAKRVLGSDR